MLVIRRGMKGDTFEFGEGGPKIRWDGRPAGTLCSKMSEGKNACLKFLTPVHSTTLSNAITSGTASRSPTFLVLSFQAF